jgi:hypothetical protein
MMVFESFKKQINAQLEDHEAQTLKDERRAAQTKRKYRTSRLFRGSLPPVWVEHGFYGEPDALCFDFTARFSQMPHFKRFVDTGVDLDSLAETLGLLYLREPLHGCDIFPERKIACQTPHDFKVEQRAQFNTNLVSKRFLRGIERQRKQWQLRNLQRSVSGALISGKTLSQMLQRVDEFMRDAFNRFKRKMGPGMSHHWDTAKKRAECAREILEWRIELEIPVKDHVRFGWGSENIRKLIEDQAQS